MVEPTTVTVHRCRFVDHTPSAITALAFPPSPLPSVKGKKRSEASKSHVKFGTLAVGRANGNIDLLEWTGNEKELQSAQAWVVRKTLSGLYPSKVDSLAFIIRHPDELGPDDNPTWSDLRLFSSGGGSELIEWNLERGCIRRTINSQGGAIWCIAANPASNTLAIGCEDGTVRLLSVTNDTLTLSRRFDRLKSRVLSIAWGPPTPKQNRANNRTATPEELSEDDDDDDDDDWTDSWLVTGGSDSSLRKWDVTTGREIDRMATEKIRGERTLVWSVGVLGDGTIISGDSLGMVKFWDSWTCTQLATFKAHGADVLCIAIDPEGKAIYTSGVDQKVAQFALAKATSTDKGSFGFQGTSSRWVQTSSRRLHSHDVRALAIWPVYTPLPAPYRKHHPINVAPILASGGLDMLVTVTPVALPSSTIVKIVNPLVTSSDATFENSYHSRLPYSSGPSGTSSISVARDAKLIACMREAGLSIWRLVSESITTEDDPLPSIQDPESRDWEKVLEMDLNVNGNLVASAISNDGQWLVASDSFETKLFRLVTDTKGSLRSKRIRDLSTILEQHLKISAPTSSTGAVAFQFSPDSSRLIMTTAVSSHVLVLDLTGDSPRVLRRFDHHRLRDTVIHNRVVKGRRKSKNEVTDAEMSVDEEASGEESDEAEAFNLPTVVVSILRIAVSPDGQWLATSDDHMRTHVFNLDSLQHHCALPSFPRPAQAITFDPAHPNVLTMAFPDNTVQFYNVETRQFPTWGKDTSSALPRKVINAHDPVTGVVFYPIRQTSEGGHNRYILLWGSTWICRLSLAEDKASAKSSKKRRRESMKEPTAAYDHEEQAADYKMITHYRPVLFLDFLSNGELVIVERPLIDILSTLPPPYFKPKYGTS
ncbi:hypothetical protein M378DRAFT_66031 [Amanita muscaria Koide BX008]|uniref:Uncharacterized protein n=1 Tax=Amanita muscaria (strain Koide BX008) TaxID=946122 RepID=A0A0C2T563_AMAMK|nr:hypothetical protein M378DRAFT_66031 [Amanita muscaria Koide BX008]